MANIDDYNAKIETIREIPDNKTLEPTMPVDTYLQEGENLAKWSIMDAEALATIAITLAVLNDLPVRAGALREAQSIWFKDRNSQLEAQREWAEAIKNNTLPGSNFDYSSRLVEMSIMGVMAQRFNTRLEYDAANMKVTNHPELDVYIKEPVRKGWEYGENI